MQFSRPITLWIMPSTILGGQIHIVYCFPIVPFTHSTPSCLWLYILCSCSRPWAWQAWSTGDLSFSWILSNSERVQLLLSHTWATFCVWGMVLSMSPYHTALVPLPFKDLDHYLPTRISLVPCPPVKPLQVYFRHNSQKSGHCSDTFYSFWWLLALYCACILCLLLTLALFPSLSIRVNIIVLPILLLSLFLVIVYLLLRCIYHICYYCTCS